MLLSLSLGRPGPYRKPVVQILRRDGRVLGYAKVAWNPVTADLVATEASMLSMAGARASRSFIVPGLLHHGSWNGRPLLVVGPIPSGARRLRPVDRPPPSHITTEIAGLAGLRSMPIGDSPWLRLMQHRVAEFGQQQPGAIASALATQLHRVGSHADVILPFGVWHGDWVPWNLAMDGDRVVAWDWEHGSMEAPLGFDLLHFEFQFPFVAQRFGLLQAAARCRARGRNHLRRLGLSPSKCEVAVHAYLLEAMLREAPPKAWSERIDPRITAQSVARMFGQNLPDVDD